MPSRLDSAIAIVNSDQLKQYNREGWVKVPSLISQTAAAELLAAAHGYEDGFEASPRGSVQRDLRMWREWRFVARDDGREPFASLAYSREVGESISLLSDRNVAVRYWNDILTRKNPAKGSDGSTPTGWHQDFPNHPFDRLGGATLWLALDDVTVDQGAMQFMSGSHREGPLGRTYSTGPEGGGLDQLGENPWLAERYPISEPVTLGAGDATFHHPLVVHGTAANLTDRPRWSFIVMYVPADAVYTGATYPASDNLGLTVGKHFEHPFFPITFDPADRG